jgi:hypothetical protein
VSRATLAAGLEDKLELRRSGSCEKLSKAVLILRGRRQRAKI